MTCEHPSCSFHIFARCSNHCMQNVCLKHLMEHEDIFLRDYTHLLDQLDRSTDILTREVNLAMMEVRRCWCRLKNECMSRSLNDVMQKSNKSIENIIKNKRRFERNY